MKLGLNSQIMRFVPRPSSGVQLTIDFPKFVRRVNPPITITKNIRTHRINNQTEIALRSAGD